jgi:hypothetical protein
MKNINDGGSAFATGQKTEYYEGSYHNVEGERGMSLRQYYAAHADIPWNAVIETLKLKMPERNGFFKNEEFAAYRAALAFVHADAMITFEKQEQEDLSASADENKQQPLTK